MKEWYSGLLPYPWLLPVQILIILVLGWICVDFTRQRGFSARPRPFFGRGLLVFGYVYLGDGAALRAAHDPDPGGALVRAERFPIFFHWVLATFLIVFGRWHRERLLSQRR